MNAECIEKGRMRIADIDAEIAKLVYERTAEAEKIGIAKKRQGMQIKDSKAERRVLERYCGFAAQYGLPEENMKAIALILIETAIDREERIQ